MGCKWILDHLQSLRGVFRHLGPPGPAPDNDMKDMLLRDTGRDFLSQRTNGLMARSYKTTTKSYCHNERTGWQRSEWHTCIGHQSQINVFDLSVLTSACQCHFALVRLNMNLLQLGLWLRLECSLDSLSIDSAHVSYVSEGYDVAYNRRTASQPSYVVLRVTWYVKTFRNVNYVCWIRLEFTYFTGLIG